MQLWHGLAPRGHGEACPCNKLEDRCITWQRATQTSRRHFCCVHIVDYTGHCRAKPVTLCLPCKHLVVIFIPRIVICTRHSHAKPVTLCLPCKHHVVIFIPRIIIFYTHNCFAMQTSCRHFYSTHNYFAMQTSCSHFYSTHNCFAMRTSRRHFIPCIIALPCKHLVVTLFHA